MAVHFGKESFKVRPPAPVRDGFPFPVTEEVHRCQFCNTPFFVGRLGPGTVIEVLCKRRNCPGPRKPQRIVKL